jgi:hypothetical protein
MANSNGWGDGAANNSIGWGQGANNNIGWGKSHSLSSAGLTDIVGLTTDSDAQAFITAAAITDATQKSAIDTLVKGLKTDGIWTKMKAVYPFVTDNRNLLSYTEDFTNGYWSKNGATVTANNTTAPDGTLTANRIVYSTTNNYIYGVSTLSGGVGTQSFYVKGTAGETLYADDGYTSAPLITLTGDWQRVTFTTTRSVGQLHGILVGTYSGATARTIWLWGAQVDAAATATTYQPIATTQQAYIASQFKYNLKDPRDLDAAFRLVFNGGWTHSSTGATPNGTNGYADTKFDQTLLSQTNGEIGVYLRTNIKATYIDIGAYAAANDYSLFTYISLGGDQIYGKASCPDIGSGYNPTNSLGLFSINADGVNTQKFYKNGVLVATKNVASGATTSKNIYLSAGNGAASPVFYSTRQLALSYISQTLNATDASNLYTRVQQFQVSLSRNV